MARSTACRPTSRPHYKYWKAPENARALATSINARLASEYPNKVMGEIIVPRGTLNCATEKEMKRRKDARIAPSMAMLNLNLKTSPHC